MKHILAILVMTITSCLLVADGAQALDDGKHYFEITPAQAEAAISRALEADGVGPKVSSNLATVSKSLYDYHRPMTVEVKTLSYDEKTQQWKANLYFMADGEVISAMPASGRYDILTTVPVLQHAIRYGQVISATDIEWKDFPIARLRHETVTDPDALLGKTARRTISAMRPVRAEELAEPAIMEKNSFIKMVYRNSNMEITTSGVALEAGAKGDVISVRNVNSNKIVHAVITAPNSVSVAPSGIVSSQVAERNPHGFN